MSNETDRDSAVQSIAARQLALEEIQAVRPDGLVDLVSQDDLARPSGDAVAPRPESAAAPSGDDGTSD